MHLQYSKFIPIKTQSRWARNPTVVCSLGFGLVGLVWQFFYLVAAAALLSHVATVSLCAHC